MNPREFRTDGHLEPHTTFVDIKKYAKILDAVVIGYVDIIVLYNNEVLLGKRQRKPIQNWWIIGGRMNPGESFNVTASRNIEKELGLKIDPLRFSHTNISYSSIHGNRLQPPQENGSHTLAVVMSVKITKEEFSKIKSNEEYSELKLFPPKAIISSNSFTQPIKKLIEDFFAKQNRETLLPPLFS